MLGRAFLVAAVALALVTAGCLASSGDEEVAPAPTTDAPSTDGQSLPTFELRGTDCQEGGGHSVHPRNVGGVWDLTEVLPEPWTFADVLEDVGPQLTYSEAWVLDPRHPIPEEGETWGNYHATVTCESWTFNGQPKEDLVFGYVGTRVTAPPFDAQEEAKRHYVITVVGSSDEEVNTALREAGFEGDPTTGSIADDGTRVDTLLRTDSHGEYETIFPTERYGEAGDWTKRLWWQHETENGSYVPMALDLDDTGAVHRVAPRGAGYFGHWGTDMHGPQGGASANSAAILYEGFDRVITFGPRPDVALDAAYHHG